MKRGRGGERERGGKVKSSVTTLTIVRPVGTEVAMVSVSAILLDTAVNYI